MTFEIYQASSAQKRIYLLNQIQGESILYNIPQAWIIDGTLDKKKLENAFNALGERQESLRTSFTEKDGRVFQQIHSEINLEFHILSTENETIEKALENFTRPFNLENPPLWRVGILELEKGRNVLLLDIHHIISDGISLGIFIYELMALYSKNELPVLEFQYVDFTLWQNRTFESDNMKEQEAFWLNIFEGELPALEFPTDYPRTASNDINANTVTFNLNQLGTHRLKHLAHENNTTLYALLISLTNILLSRYSGQEDIIIASPVTGRSHSEFQQIIGMFVNTLAIRTFIKQSLSFNEFVKSVSSHILDAFDNQDYPFELLVEKLNPERNLSRNPLTDIMVVLQDFGHPIEIPGGFTVSSYAGKAQTAKFDLLLTAYEEETQIHFDLNYRSTLFKHETIQRIVSHFKNLIVSLCENPNQFLYKINMLSDDEQKQILFAFNNTKEDYPADKTIAVLFEEQVEKVPDSIALVHAHLNHCITYRELNDRANQLAWALLEKGVSPDTIAAIMLERSIEMICGVLGVLKSGGAYLPLNPGYPLERIRYLLQESQSKILITTKDLEEDKKIKEEKNLPQIDVIFTGVSNVLPSLYPVPNPPSPGSLAYVIYTSGSTGRPKGVMVDQRNVIRLVKNSRFVDLKPMDRLLQTGALEFDASTFEIWGTLLNGLALYISEKDDILNSKIIKQLILRNDIHIIWLTSSLFNILSSIDLTIYEGLRCLLVGGDTLSPRHINSLKKRYPVLKMINGYGPTENTTFSTTYLIDKCYEERIPIGYPITNSTAYIVDCLTRLVPIGVPGELWVGGEGVARGYLNNPELTAEKFISVSAISDLSRGDLRSPEERINFIGRPQDAPTESLPSYPLTFSPSFFSVSARDVIPSVAKIYKTGDRARWLADGAIDFLGRSDHQVKIRGFRIELGEIENRLSTHEKVKDAVVIIRENRQSERYIIAYVVGKEELDENRLRAFLSKDLPEYMIPAYIVQLERIPLNTNGKVDRKALPEPRLSGIEEYAAPRNRVEEKLLLLWSEVLGLESDKIDIDSNFFKVGGHSLKATILTAKINKEFGVKIPLSELFKFPTVRGMSSYILTGQSPKHYESIMPAEEKEYYPLSSAQKRLYILQQMDEKSIVYNIPIILKLEGEIQKEKLIEIFWEFVERNESFRTSFLVIEGLPVQRIHKYVKFNLEYYLDLTGLDPKQGTEDRQDIQEFVKLFVKPFDLMKAPLIRVGLIKRSSLEHILMIDMHHIISDGSSVSILVKDFISLYIGNRLTVPGIHYKDFAEWRYSIEQQQNTQRQEHFWLNEFEGEFPVLDLPLDFKRPAVQSFEGEAVSFHIEKKETQLLKCFAIEKGLTLYMVLLSTFSIFLSKLSSQEDIVIGTPTAGRNHSDLQKIIGMFVNTLALRIRPEGTKTVREFLVEVKEKTLAAFENQDYQYDDLVEKVVAERDMSRNPLFDVMFVLQNIDFAGMEIPGLKLSPLSSPHKISKFDLMLSAVEADDIVSFTVEYCTKLFHKETIERFFKYFRNILSFLLENQDSRLCISGIEILSPGEKREILVDFNDTQVSYQGGKTLHGLFEEQVNRTPNRVAVIYKSSQLTYRDLSNLSGYVAGCLKENGVTDRMIVAVQMERGLEVIGFILGILKAGATYLPISPDYPQDRIEFILKDSGAGLLLSLTEYNVVSHGAHGGHEERIDDKKIRGEEEKQGLYSWQNNFGNISMQRATFSKSSLPTFLQESRAEGKSFPFHPSPFTLHTCYIIYTSGSTGKPKGVLVEHASAVNLLYAMQERYPVDENGAYLFKTSYMFDVSVTELFGWYMGGGCLVVLEQGGEKDPFSIIKCVSRNRVTHINFVPSMFYVFLEYINHENKSKLSSLLYIMAAGEALLPEIVEKYRRLDLKIALENLYGPTEATVYASWYSLNDWEGKGSILIGKPLPNVQLYIIGKGGTLQPVQIPGELCIGGSGLAAGYLNRPELTAEKFVLMPSATRDLFEKRSLDPQKLLIGGDKKDYESTHDLSQDNCQGCNPQTQITDTDTQSRQPTHTHTDTHTLYKTGDLARWMEDGNIEFIGRIDTQVKIRGFRIELGEIENRLLSFGAIKEAVVEVKASASGDKIIVAYFISDMPHSEEEFRDYLLKELPDYMIPSYFIKMETLPLTTSGKVDRKALPLPGIKTGKDFVAPATENEKTLAAIWSEVLGVKKGRIGVFDNFFHLGGHSLKATVLTARIHKTFGVQIPLSELFKIPTIHGLSVYIEQEQGENPFESISPAEEKEYYPLSSAQTRLYLLNQIDNEGKGYNIPFMSLLEGEVQYEKIETVFRELIERHWSFRTSFHLIDGEPVQRIHESHEIDFNIPFIESNTVNIDTVIGSFIRPFDLSTAPLLRVALIKKQTSQYILLVDMHHIISDGSSNVILINDIIMLYKNIVLPPLHSHYKDFAEWKNSNSQEQAIHKQEEFWLDEFSCTIPVLELPVDFTRPAQQRFEGNTLSFELEKEETEALKSLAAREGLTLYMVLLSAFSVLLSKLSNQEDIVIGTPTAGRNHSDFEKIIGMFVNTIALRTFPTGSKSLSYFFQEIKEKTLKAFENQDYQYDDLVEKVVTQRDVTRNPLFDTMFVLQNMDNKEIVLPGLTLSPYKYENKTSKFDMTLIAMEDNNKILFNLEYCTALFTEETIHRFTRYLQKLLSRIALDFSNEILISELEIITDTEKQQLLIDFNDSRTQYPYDKTIHGLFEDYVDRIPHHPAVIYKNKVLTYRCFDQFANRLAHYLHSQTGIRKGDRILVAMDRSVELIVVLMGIMKSGAAYIPVDVSLPTERLRIVINDAEVYAVISIRKYFDLFTQLKLQCNKLRHVLYIDDPTLLSQVDQYPVERPLPVPVENPAYVMYTSGSTGLPKGVLVIHRTIVNTIWWRKTNYEYAPGHVSLQVPPYFFDSSVTDIFTPLSGGARLVLIADNERTDLEVLRYIIPANDISHFIVVPVFYNVLLEEIPTALQSIKMITCAGENFPDELIRKHFEKLPHTRIFNEYGPTENSVNSTAYELTPNSTKAFIGKPISNVEVYLLDRYHQLVPIGVIGEIGLAGASLSQGYLNRPELTSERFVTVTDLLGLLNLFDSSDLSVKCSPWGRNRDLPLQNKYFAINSTHTLYKTGDLARWTVEGNLEFMGRVDSQVKIRGIRIETGEIENRLMQHKNIKEAVVIAQDGAGKDKFLCAYFVPIEKQKNTETDFRVYLSEMLPAYMIPSYFIEIDSVPFTSTGKINRDALPGPIMPIDEYIAPRNDLEKTLAQIWADVLGVSVDSIGIDSDFFKLGGHSLKATIAVSRIHKMVNVKVPIVEIFTNSTVRLMAIYISHTHRKEFVAILPCEKKEYYPLSPAQKRLFLLQQMDLNNTVYNLPIIFPFTQELDILRLQDTFSRLIHRHESLRTSFIFVNDEPVQRVHDSVHFELEYLEPNRSGSETQNPYQNHFVRAFDLSKAPLLRVGFVSCNDEDNYPLLMIDMHHIITDGISHTILKYEFNSLYNSIQDTFPPLPIQYKDYSQWLSGETQSNVINQQQAYWLEMLSGELPVLKLPIDYPRPLIQEYEGNSVDFLLSVEESQALKRFAKETGSTLHMSALSVFTVLLSKIGNQEDIIVGTPVGGRRHADLEGIIGVFINMLAFRICPVGSKRFINYLEEVKEVTVNGYENQEYQFEQLVDTINPVRDLSRNPIFDVMFNLVNFEDFTRSHSAFDVSQIGEGASVSYIHKPGVSKFDLTLNVTDLGECMQCSFEYSTALFKPQTIERFISWFKQVIYELSVDIRQKIDDVCIITPSQRCQILYEFNNTQADYPADKTIHYFFEKQVEKVPDMIACYGVSLGYEEENPAYDTHLTYLQLNEQAGCLAGQLIEAGILPGDIVGIKLDRSIETIIGLLGILKAGAAYLPIDTGYPQERIDYILKDSGAVLLMSLTKNNEHTGQRASFEFWVLGFGLNEKGDRQIKKYEVGRVKCEGENDTETDHRHSTTQLSVKGTDEFVIHEKFEDKKIREEDEKQGVYHKYGDIPIPRIPTIKSFWSNLFSKRLAEGIPSLTLNTNTNTSYIIYTSGSTGKPKGVIVDHASAVNLLYAMQERYPVDKNGAYLFKTSYMFDVSVTELFGWYFGGGRLVVLEKGGERDPLAIIDSVSRNRITHINFVPSMFNVFLEYVNHENKSKLSSLLYIMAAGEALLPEIVEKYRLLDLNIALENLYGPTEATVYASWYSLNDWDGKGSIPIGKPLPNVQLYIIGKGGTLQPVQIPGELCIGGSGLAAGYLNRPELTAERFVLMPQLTRDLFEKRALDPQKLLIGGAENYFAISNDLRQPTHTHTDTHTLYKTGDLARWMEDGNIEFLGRIDHQVKIRGFRIELGEIENRLRTHPAVGEAFVIDIKKNDTVFLCGYYTQSSKIKGTPILIELKQYLEEKLPSYMVPSCFVRIDEIPLSSNGKLNRQALPMPVETDFISCGVYEAPKTNIQQLIAETWKEVLGRERVGIHDNFYDIGGSSLDFVKVGTKLKEALGKEIPVSTLFAYPTIYALERYLNGEPEASIDQEETLDRSESIDEGIDFMLRMMGTPENEE